MAYKEHEIFLLEGNLRELAKIGHEIIGLSQCMFGG
jgi:hypothetical protein